jgi:hypothetical protein
MPRKLRQVKKRIDLFTEEQREMLLCGHDWFKRSFRSRREHSEKERQGFAAAYEERMRETWFLHRNELLAYWLQDPEAWKKKHEGRREPLGEPEPGGIGTRPWGWWRFESPEEPRRRVGGGGIAVRDLPNCPDWAKGLTFGKPHVFEGYDFNDPPTFESEAEYLRRWNLLSHEEEMAIANGGLRPARAIRIPVTRRPKVQEPVRQNSAQPGRIVEFGARSDEDEDEDDPLEAS